MFVHCCVILAPDTLPSSLHMYILHGTHFEEYCFLSSENKLMHNTMPLCIADSDLVLDFFRNIKILKTN